MTVLWLISNPVSISMSSEKLFKDMADRMAADGYRDAGYTYVNIDVTPFISYFYVACSSHSI